MTINCYAEPISISACLARVLPVLFLFMFVVLAAWGKHLRGGGWLATIVSGLAAAIVLFAHLDGYGGGTASITWFQVGTYPVRIGYGAGPLSGMMLLLVTSITFLVHVFSLAYIQHDPMRHRYWAYLALFSASMCGLVLADDLLVVFVCWELVGLASWLLVGFWFQKRIAAAASQKAFIVNRIADVGFILALMLIWREEGSFRFPLDGPIGETFTLQLLVGIGLFLAAIGKSAQFPFQVWLPDAMAGPTPVSSLIHAATMVAAGVYLMVQVEPTFVPGLMVVIASVGAFTALIAAISALTQTDIKRVLAYSTVSQLGFMVMGVGVGASDFAFLHLVAHAFFKCGLFLVAGAVIHQLHAAQDREGIHYDAQDMRFMGGLRKKMPLVFATWLFFAASLAGLPFFSGFLSKDGIIVGAMAFADHHGTWAWLVPGAAILASLLTAFYIARQGMLVFMGKHRAQGAGAPDTFFAHLPQADFRMLLPLLLLAVASTWVILSPEHPFHVYSTTLQTSNYPLLPLLLTGLAMLGIGMSAYLYRKGPLPARANAFFFDLSFRHFFLDDFYRMWIVKPFFAFSRLMAAVDKHVVDGLVQVVAGIILRKGRRSSLSTASDWADEHGIDSAANQAMEPQESHSLSRMVAWMDQRLIDRLVNGVAGAAMRMGKRLSKLQSGKLQLYLLYTVLGLLLLILALIYLFT